MELFLVFLGMVVLIITVGYVRTLRTDTISIAPAIATEVEPQITDAVTVVVEPEVVLIEEIDPPKKRGRKPKITTATKKPVKGKKQVAPKTTRGRKKKS